MSGLDVLGVAATAAGLIDQAIGIVARIRKAHERQKGLVEILASHSNELSSTKDVARLILDEKALQTAAVASQLVKMDTIMKKLVTHLEVMDPGETGAVRQLAHQLVHGSKEEQILSDIMSELNSAKSSLTLHIQVAHVGLSRNTQEDLVANMATIRRVDAVVQNVFGDGKGLKLAEALKHLTIEGNKSNTAVPLSEGDVACISDACFDPETAAKNPTERFVNDNLTLEQALQINGPIGVDGWRELNHAVSRQDFRDLLAARLAGIQKT